MKNKLARLWCLIVLFNEWLSACADDRVYHTLRGRFGLGVIVARTSVMILVAWLNTLYFFGIIPMNSLLVNYSWVLPLLMPFNVLIFWYYFHEIRHATWRLVNRQTS